MINNTTTLPTGSRSELRDIVSSQLQILLEHKNYDGAKALLIPVQPVDIAEAIRQSLALRDRSFARSNTGDFVSFT